MCLKTIWQKGTWLTWVRLHACVFQSLEPINSALTDVRSVQEMSASCENVAHRRKYMYLGNNQPRFAVADVVLVP